jgi:hypothetical protein
MARIVCLCVLLVAASLPASAQDTVSAPAVTPSFTVDQGAVVPAVTDPLFRERPVQKSAAIAHRPAALMPMYVSTAALQGMDYMTTRKAISTGQGTEANPVMQSVVGNNAAFLAVKAGTVAGTIWMSEKLWKRNRVAAIALMAGVNGAMAAVVSHNMSALR